MAKYILLDTETTGAEEEDRIIQLGYIVLGRPSDPIEVQNEFCDAPVPIKIGAMEVHGITPEMIQGKPLCRELNSFKRLHELNKSTNYLLIHNAKFDLGMLAKEGFENSMQLIDTLRCAKHLFEEEPYHRLQYFRYALGLYQEEADEAKKLGITVKAHDAIGDVLVLKLFMSQLVAKCKERFPVNKPMEKLVELTRTPVMIKELRFGKYKGREVAEIAREDAGYLNWMLKSMESLDEDLRYTIEQHLGH